MTQYRQVPTFDQPLRTGEVTTASWYRYFQAHDLGQPPSAEKAITGIASPFIYTAPHKGNLIVSGGTVSGISYSRSGTFYSTGQTSGVFNLALGDQLKIVFSVVPTVIFAPT
jgi:hypothetical protein